MYLDGNAPRCVKHIAGALGVAEEVSSKNLQLLESGGFLEQERRSKFLFYSLDHADGLLQAVLDSLKKDEKGFPETMHVLTACTHERRVRIVSELGKGELEFSMLGFKSGISLRALERQLGKLVQRGFVSKRKGCCRLLEPESALARMLIELAQKFGTPAQVCQGGEVDENFD